MAESKKNTSAEYWVIFLSAFVIRCVLGSIFFGSVDLTAVIDFSQYSFGGLVYYLPYFPLVCAIVWLAGAVNLLTPLPLAFSCKFVPILFDCFLALLIYDVVRRRNPKSAFKAGLLYAFSPVAIIINCFHVQWESICLFFLVLAFYLRDFYGESVKKYALFGVMFALSVMVKPIALLFAPVFIKPLPQRKNFPYQVWGIASFILTVLVFLVLFKVFGYSIKQIFYNIVNYSNKGIQVFGLPFAYPFSQIALLKTRLWLVVIVFGMAAFYHLGKVNSFNLILITFSLMLGIAGLGPQYLLWLIPFLLVTVNFRLCAGYSFVVTVFMLLFYINPYVSEAAATFSTLKGFQWLMPPSFFTSETLVPFIKIIGNYIVPFCLLGMGAYLLKKPLDSKKASEPEPEPAVSFQPLYKYFAFTGIFAAVSLAFYLLLRNTLQAEALAAVIKHKLTFYALSIPGTVVPGGPSGGLYDLLVGSYAGLSYFNIIFLLFLGSIVWGLLAVRETTAKK